ncbi:hypothetical protein VN97_g10275 [Penicillium thymicola]|uniref:Uncharacterized protein n=1 Tax=Penicillium thymicola TaxID=293382 RepID=A0AAI9TA40_PENTH|nr:hypothetical protein VN97_g10275 [Penicillium thymicola]
MLQTLRFFYRYIIRIGHLSIYHRNYYIRYQPLRPFNSTYPLFLFLLLFSLNGFVSEYRSNHGLQRPNPHDCRVERGYVLSPVRAVLLVGFCDIC